MVHIPPFKKIPLVLWIGNAKWLVEAITRLFF